MINLSKRLMHIARIVQSSSSVTDVGTDHGYIPVWLKQNGFNGKIIAADINLGPLNHARETAKVSLLENEIEFILCNGLDKVEPCNAEAIIIAGMGGETIASILGAAPWTRDGCLLVLQPMSKSAYLRQWLFDNGYCVVSEQLIDDGNIYELLTVKGGSDVPYSPAELLTGHYNLISSDELYDKKINELIKKTNRAIDGLKSSKDPMHELVEEKERLLSNLTDLIKQ